MGLQVSIPRRYSEEARYICDAVLADYLGLAIAYREHDGASIELAADGKCVVFKQTFFEQAARHWLGTESLAKRPLPLLTEDEFPFRWLLRRNTVPLIAGGKGITRAGGRIEVEPDLFGGAFFMLTRYEEAVSKERDALQRFPASASLACQEGFLDRPLVNEYIELIWSILIDTWPQEKRRPRQFKIRVENDIDRPFMFQVDKYPRLRDSWKSAVKSLAIWRRGDDSLNRHFYRAWAERAIRMTGNSLLDPYFQSYFWLHDLVDRHNIDLRYYVMSNHSSDVNARYELSDPNIMRLLEEITGRGFEIGFHPGYDTFNDLEQMRAELDALASGLRRIDPNIALKASRQHYLRWDGLVTPMQLEALGIERDSTLVYADRPGFRTGACFEYRMFDLKGRRPMALRQDPITAMEASMIEGHYLNLDHSEADEEFDRLRAECEFYKGTFAVLWHSHYLGRREQKRLMQHSVGLAA